MDAAPLTREQVLPLLAAVNNHGVLGVKLSSLKQAKDILLSIEPSYSAELLPYLVELQSSPETLVRKCLLEVIEEIGAKRMEHMSILLPVLFTFLKDNNYMVAKQSIAIGTKLFYSVLEELAFQFQRRGIVERWLEELWTWMAKYRDAVVGIIFEVGPVGPKLLAMKFLETYILNFTSESGGNSIASWAIDGHPVLDPPALASDANRYLSILLDILRSPTFPGSLTISAVNILAAVARKKPVQYKSVLTALLDFNPNFEMVKNRHAVSIQYSLRTAFLGFLRCTDPVIAESRERLLKVLRGMGAGDAADQVMRQVDKIMKNNERASRDLQLTKDEQLRSQQHILGDMTKKRAAPLENEDRIGSFDGTSKRLHHDSHNKKVTTVDINDGGMDHASGRFPKPPLLEGDLTAVETMIALIGALIAEGERGVESLEILISNIHPDLLADIVIMNMKYLPVNSPPLTKLCNVTLNRPSDTSRDPAHSIASNGFETSTQTSIVAAQLPISSSTITGLPISEVPISANLSVDSKRDPRRDPRRLDPRRMVGVDAPPTSVTEDNTNSVHHGLQSNFDSSRSSIQPVQPSAPVTSGTDSGLVMPKLETELDLLVSPVTSEAELHSPKYENSDVQLKEFSPDEIPSHPFPPVTGNIEDSLEHVSVDVSMLSEAYSPPSQETNEILPDPSNVEASEVASLELRVVPPCIKLDDEQQRTLRKHALQRIITAPQNLHRLNFNQTKMALIARLFAQGDVDDVVGIVQGFIVSDFVQRKDSLLRPAHLGHEFVMQILYHLRSVVISDSVSAAAALYDNFLLGVAKSLLEDLPASDKTFSRLLGEVPYIPDSVMMLLGDVCTENHLGENGHDLERVTQGLGAVWSLILGRPLNREACLDIVLKCSIHGKDDVRAKAIRLVANKLYSISSLSEKIEQFAMDKFLSVVDQCISAPVISDSPVSGKSIEGQVESQIREALGHISLFFALCSKKRTLLHMVFETYARASDVAKQAVQRHIPVLVKSLGSDSGLLPIISNLPEGSEPLVIQVIYASCEGKTPAPDLVATVKHLYGTRLRDATILIPVLSAFSRDEVLPIFPQLVSLPLDKFQIALAHILQGSAHTGPALTPVEVLVAIHDISPEKDNIPLKKITDACSACFEQRTVFTQLVLSKALNQMIDRSPLPMLFMRTVIQAIDAFPTLVNFVMEILSKLVNRQIWRMPKLWVGFLKCISQTQPHSFHVLLQLPSPQLESALSKYANLRAPLAAFVDQSSVKASLPRSTLMLLGLASEAHAQQPYVT